MSTLLHSVGLAVPTALILFVSAAQAEVSTKFIRYDRDADGKISEAEFVTLYRTSDATAIFRKLDLDASGYLNETEFEKLTQANTDSKTSDDKEEGWVQ